MLATKFEMRIRNGMQRGGNDEIDLPPLDSIPTLDCLDHEPDAMERQQRLAALELDFQALASRLKNALDGCFRVRLAQIELRLPGILPRDLAVHTVVVASQGDYDNVQ